MCIMKKPPSPQRIRLTITVTQETHEAFQHYAEASGTSIGRAMGDWLGDQVSAVTYVALQMEQVREAPGEIALQLVPRAEAAGRPAAPAANKPPRPVIRGGNSPAGGTK
jgi:hypothetical protein